MHIGGRVPRQRSRYCSWLRAEQLRDQSSSPGIIKNFHFSVYFRICEALTFSCPVGTFTAQDLDLL
jgi:hypothetical protein